MGPHPRVPAECPPQQTAAGLGAADPGAGRAAAAPEEFPQDHHEDVQPLRHHRLHPHPVAGPQAALGCAEIHVRLPRAAEQALRTGGVQEPGERFSLEEP